uniref:BTB domain-containing protein n=1 Tax=Alexandrium monilatum TaxID=311494 RepID=A0A7S4VFA6_9DINO
MAAARERGREVLVGDLRRLYERARTEEQKGKRESTNREVVISGQRYYAHSCILSARSNFFEKALTQQMIEGVERVMELRHTATEVPRAAGEALLLFLYAGSTEGVSSSEAAWGVCDLLGAESGDFLELSGCEVLREECTDRIMGEVRREELAAALLRAQALGHATKQLRGLLLENLVWDPARVRPPRRRRRRERPRTSSQSCWRW